MKKELILAIFMASGVHVWGLESPDGRLALDIGKDGMTLLHTDSRGRLPMLDLLCGRVKPLGDTQIVTTDYKMIAGKRKHCLNSYSEQRYILPDRDTLTVRLYNDGLAWKKNGASEIEFVKPVHVWLQNWTDCYENFFPQDPEIKTGTRFGYPALVEFPGGHFGLLTESGITPEEAGVSMYARGGNVFRLVPDGPQNGGWQTFIAGTLGDIVESTIVTDNSAESRIGDTSWIEPGVAAWIYWAYNHGSNDFNIISRYVDMAAELGLPYVLIDAEWDEMKDGKNIEDAVSYALSKGVKPMIWYNSSVGWVDGAPGPKYRLNTPENLEKEFAWCEKIGVSGVKIDFFSGDTNLNLRFMADLLEAAARHNLAVNFHGAPLPRGWQRTYPNLLTTEAVYGAEWYNNVPTFTDKAARHNATLPFTRNVVGSMDYTPCAFTDSQHPHITTHAHELALTTLFESGIQHLADRPESLLRQPGAVRRYLSELPAAWDETVFVGGYPGEYAVLARRHGDRWYIAGINGSDIAKKDVPLDFSRLGIDTSRVMGTMFADAASGSPDPWNIRPVAGLPDKIDMQPRGGFLIVTDGKSRPRNPISQTEFTPDPAPVVVGDTLYLYTGHDDPSATDDNFVMRDYLCFTTTDMVNWTHHAPIFNNQGFGTTDCAYAAQMAYRNGKWYYYTSTFGIPVLVSDSPYGPFTNPLGGKNYLIYSEDTNYSGHGWEDIDPTVLIDDDGQAYMYWGNNALYAVRLNEDMVSYNGDIVVFDIADKAAFGDDYEEAPWITKRGDKYYLIYAAHCPEDTYWAWSDGPLGPWKYGGEVMRAFEHGGMGNHTGMAEFKGQWYFFYMDEGLPEAHSKRRTASVVPFDFNADGSIPYIHHDERGVLKSVSPLNPYVRQQGETIAWENGIGIGYDSTECVYVNDIDNGDWIKLREVDFGDGADWFRARIRGGLPGSAIEIRLDAPDGELLGVLDAESGIDWLERQCKVRNCQGIHDLYFVFTGSDNNTLDFDFWQFIKD